MVGYCTKVEACEEYWIDVTEIDKHATNLNNVKKKYARKLTEGSVFHITV